VVSKLGAESYKSKDNAIRSVNNILKRLTKEGFVVRKGKGKSYVYSLSDKTRTLLVNA
jgi:DNA-binding transcriptional regulator PaaX